MPEIWNQQSDAVAWLATSDVVNVVCTGVVLTTEKLAPTDVAWFKVTEQVLLPEHAPVHPPKSELENGDAVRVTVVPLVYDDEHA